MTTACFPLMQRKKQLIHDHEYGNFDYSTAYTRRRKLISRNEIEDSLNSNEASKIIDENKIVLEKPEKHEVKNVDSANSIGNKTRKHVRPSFASELARIREEADQLTRKIRSNAGLTESSTDEKSILFDCASTGFRVGQLCCR